MEQRRRSNEGERDGGKEGDRQKDRQAYRNNSKEISDRFVNTELNIQR